MAEQDGAHGFLDATAAAFLARRLEHQRLRAAAVREREVAAAAPTAEARPLPPLSIVIMIVGSRGDVQPFIPIGRRLRGAASRAHRHPREFRSHGRAGRARVLSARPAIRTS